MSDPIEEEAHEAHEAREVVTLHQYYRLIREVKEAHPDLPHREACARVEARYRLA